MDLNTEKTKARRRQYKSYKIYIDIVLETINEHEEIMQSRLHQKIIEKTGVKISKHTLNKCLDYLLVTNHINREDRPGSGNQEAFYKINKSVYKFDTDIDLRHDILLKMFNEKDEEYDEHQLVFINMGFDLLNKSLIYALINYSKNPKPRNAASDLEYYLHTCYVPSFMKLAELVQHPLKISDKTLVNLLNTHNSLSSLSGLKHNSLPIEFWPKEAIDKENSITQRYVLGQITHEEYMEELKELFILIHAEYDKIMEK